MNLLELMSAAAHHPNAAIKCRRWDEHRLFVFECAVCAYHRVTELTSSLITIQVMERTEYATSAEVRKFKRCTCGADMVPYEPA